MTKIKTRAKILKSKFETKTIILFLIIFSSLGGFGCSRAEEKSAGNNLSTPATTEKKTDDFEDSLNSVRTGNFDFVFAFRRLDGEVLSSDDKKFLKENSPRDTNQWVLTADGKTAIAGSNYKFMPENLNALKKRFSVEDYSPKVGDGDKNQNSNGG
ncbi:MAG: hypothetical protein ACR2GD_08485 [Pyrinomonadaceae bacterium]